MGALGVSGDVWTSALAQQSRTKGGRPAAVVGPVLVPRPSLSGIWRVPGEAQDQYAQGLPRAGAVWAASPTPPGLLSLGPGLLVSPAEEVGV